MDKSGFVLLWRKFQDHEFWKEQREFSRWEAWEDLFVSANHEDKPMIIKNQIIECRRGQTARSLTTWASRWGWGIKKVRLFLDLCQRLSMIKLENVTFTTRITICNYEVYQNIGHAKDTQATREGHARGTRRATNNELNELKELNPPISPLKSQKTQKTWRTSFWIYRRLVIIAYRDIISDQATLKQQQEINPSLDIKLSIKKAVVNFWGTREGWKHKTKGKAAEINMRQTLINSIDKNRVYTPRPAGSTAEQPQQSNHAMYRVIG